MAALLPGGTIGIVGGGQLGRMLALVAKRMGYKVACLEESADSPCAQVSDHLVLASLSDVEAIDELIKVSDVITFEFENINPELIQRIEASGVPVHPSSQVLRVTQNRILEKSFIRDLGLPVTEFAKITQGCDLETADRTIGYPAFLKTAGGGYDGKGQAAIKNLAEARSVFERLGGVELIWEKRVNFVKEISVVAVRGIDGDFKAFPVGENIHKENILDLTIVPAEISDLTLKEALDISRRIAEGLKIVGTFCVEMFVLENGAVLVNEIAPRPHNSGHHSIESCPTSQFEQQLRSVCGLPLGETKLESPAIMYNILGGDQGNTLSGVVELLQMPGVYLHLYGKSEAKLKRKMGHVTMIGDSLEYLRRQVEKVRKLLVWSASL